ncbi:MAG: ATP-dependent metallopeptidase FtsH/Yme1/Tma family protein [Treponema sp.]|nr:ATP-dependent metallopeptidase FtsH/Yme1/Tma family protein [Treponema sp.]
MKIKKFFLWILLVLLLAGGVWFFFFEGKSEKISYASFMEYVESESVKTVVLSENEISFELLDGKKFITTNPLTPDLAERLLLKGVDLKIEKPFEEIFSLVFDVIFYLIFFGAIILVFKKFISPNTFRVVRHTKVHFSDICGMDELKRHMMQIAGFMKHPSEAAKKGIRLPKGILLEGAPGNGKTLFARALAEEAGVSFIPAKATDFESMFMAIGPMKVKMLFRKARKNAPCIVFIDEFDGIGTRRNYSGSAIETENTRIVTAMLNELDGFEPHLGVLVLAATNSRDALDEALIRPGRFDAKYVVPFPDEKTRLELIKMYSANKALSDTCRAETLVGKFKGFSAAKIEAVLNRASMLSNQKGAPSITMEDINSAISENS